MSRFDGLMKAARAKSPVAESPAAEPVGAEPAAEPEPVAPPATPPPPSKSKDPNYTRTTVYLPKVLHRQLKVAALADEREMSEIIAELVAEWLESRRSDV